MTRTPSSHLPAPFPDRQAFARAYAFIRDVDGVYHGDPGGWREPRIPCGLPAETVYRLLPTAPDVEHAGYLTRTRIRYALGWETGAYLLSCKACTFHTHPAEHSLADLPSAKDLYAFLRYTHLRHVTVGGSLIWVFDKTMRTLPVVERLNAWEARNMIQAVAEVGVDRYAEVALRGIGLRLPKDLRRYRRAWPGLVEDRLGVQVTLLERRS